MSGYTPMIRQETPNNNTFYYITPSPYGGFVINCNDWTQSEWSDSDGYSYTTDKYGDVEFYWDEGCEGFYIPEEYIEVAYDMIDYMNTQHIDYV